MRLEKNSQRLLKNITSIRFQPTFRRTKLRKHTKISEFCLRSCQGNFKVKHDQTKLHHWAVCPKGNTLYIIPTGFIQTKNFFYLDQTPSVQWRCHVKNVYGTDNGVVLARCGGPKNELKLLFGMMTILMGTCCNFMQV